MALPPSGGACTPGDGCGGPAAGGRQLPATTLLLEDGERGATPCDRSRHRQVWVVSHGSRLAGQANWLVGEGGRLVSWRQFHGRWRSLLGLNASQTIHFGLLRHTTAFAGCMHA